MKKYLLINLIVVTFLIVDHSAAQSIIVQSISASAGVSLPISIFAEDTSGKGHGFANPGATAQVFCSVGRGGSRLSYLVGLTAIVNPLDKEGFIAMWGPNTTIEAKRYNVFGISGGAELDLETTQRMIWRLRGTIGVATISYPAHEMRVRTGSGQSKLLYRSSADDSISLNGSLGLVVHYKISPKVRLGGELDLFQSRARHLIIYEQNAYPPSYEEDQKQRIAIVNMKISASYLL